MAADETFHEEARRLATRILDVANRFDTDGLEGLREIFADDYVLHSRTGHVIGIDAYVERIAVNLGGLPGMRFVMDDLVVQGDRFAMRYHWTAPYQDGEIGSEALEINRVADGKVAETWNYQDRLSLMVQLGLAVDPLAS